MEVCLMLAAVCIFSIGSTEGNWMTTNCSTYEKDAFFGGITTKAQCVSACKTAAGLAQNGQVRFKEGCKLGNCPAGCPASAKQCACYKSKDVFPGICRDSEFCATGALHQGSVLIVALVTVFVAAMNWM